MFIVSLFPFPALKTGEGIAQPAHPVPQCHSCVLRWKPTAAGTDTQAVPHQVEDARWGQSILAGRALITPFEAIVAQFDSKCQILQKLQEPFRLYCHYLSNFHSCKSFNSVQKMEGKKTSHNSLYS